MEGSKEPNLTDNQVERYDINRMRKAVLRWISASPQQVRKQQKQARKSVQKPISTLKDLEREAPLATAQPKISPAEISAVQQELDQKIQSTTQSIQPQAQPRLTSLMPQKTVEKKLLKKKPDPFAPQKNESGSSYRILKITGFTLGLLLLVFICFSLAIYRFQLRGPVVTQITRVLPVPAAIVGSHIITFSEWQAGVAELTEYQSRQEAFNVGYAAPTASELEQHMLDRLVDRILLDKIAREYNVKVTPEELQAELDLVSQEAGGQEIIRAQLADQYGWSLKDFTTKILEPLLLYDKVSLAVNFDQRLSREANEIAEQLLIRLRTSNSSFEMLAAEYSQDLTAASGGDLGYFGPGEMVPEFEAAAFGLKPGEVSDIVTTRFGHHIIKVEEHVTDDDGKVMQIRARHILIRAVNLESYLEEKKQLTRIWKFVL